MFGSDFPFVQQQRPEVKEHSVVESESLTTTAVPSSPVIEEEPYVSYVRAPSMWPESQRLLTSDQWDMIMSGTAEKLYGTFDL